VLITSELNLFLFFINAYSDLFINDLPTILCTFAAIFAAVLAINDKRTLSVKHANTIFIYAFSSRIIHITLHQSSINQSFDINQSLDINQSNYWHQ
jgi:hypothetical protein